MKHAKASTFLTLLAVAMAGCAAPFPLASEWVVEDNLKESLPMPSWGLYNDENLLTGRHVHTLCGTVDDGQSNNARFCFRRRRDQLFIYVIPSHRTVRTARLGAGILTYVRVDNRQPVSPRSAFGETWGRAFNPRFPNASFPIDGTDPRTGEIQKGGLFDQLLVGETLSARVPLEPDEYQTFTIRLDGIAPLLRELWDHKLTSHGLR